MEKKDAALKDEKVKLKATCSSCGKTIGVKSSGLNTVPRACNCLHSSPIDPSDLPNLDEKYDVVSLIGKGGMGSVFKVKDRELDRFFAIKVLSRDLSEDTASRKRFEQEADAVRALNHPGIVAVYGRSSTEDGIPFILMDYLEGKSLSDFIKEEGCLDPITTLEIVRQISDAISHAHQKGVIHRDIKPTNIILNQTGDGALRIQIVDFGIAKVMPSTNRQTCDLTQTGDVFGSPHYMSPEQCLGFMLDQRSDIYCLGCTIYEAITGSAPFAGENPIQLVVKHINDDPPPIPRELKSSKLAKGLESIVFHCLAKKPEDRYQSIDDLLIDLDLLKDGKKIPNYQKHRRAKPTITKKQTIGAIALAFMSVGFMGVGGAHHLLLNNTTAGLFLLVVVSAGMYAFFTSATESIERLKKGNTSPRQWWLILTQISLVTLGLAFMPTILILTFLGYQGGPPWVQDINLVASIGQAIFCILTLIFSLRYFLSRTTTKVGPASIIFHTLLMIALTVVIALKVVPETTAKLPGWLAYEAHHRPQLAIDFYKAASKLNTRNPAYNARAAQIEETERQYNQTIDDLKEAIARAPDAEPYLEKKVRLEIKVGRLEEAQKDVLSMINSAKLAEKGYALKAVILSARGDHKNAIDQFKKRIDRYGSNMDRQDTFNYIGSLIALKKYDEA
ncbi:MAG: protein kinase, partial [Candidatus Obscuribacterales bacterium]|nr:protein kinase [Candidatus Obscuribacterales bacterium]